MNAGHRRVPLRGPLVCTAIIALWALDAPKSKGQSTALTCPWKGITTFTNRLESTSFPKSEFLDPSDVRVAFHPQGTYGETLARSNGCGETEVSACDSDTLRFQVTEGLANVVFTLRRDAVTTEEQAELVRTSDGFDVFEFSGIGLLGGERPGRVLFGRMRSDGATELLSKVCVVSFNLEFVERQVQDLECVFEDF
ncbi:MAG: hypothetical protein AAF627_11945 [Myxococcota bacterium]